MLYVATDRAAYALGGLGLFALSGWAANRMFAHVHLRGGPAPVRGFLPELIDLVWNGKINPGKVFDLRLPLDQVAEGYRAMDERRQLPAARVVRS